MADEDKVALTFDLRETEADTDWLKAGRLREKCEAGDVTACQQLQDMEETRLYDHDELTASTDVKEG